MNQTVKVDLGDRAYDIEIGRNVGAIDGLAGAADGRVLIVSDSNVDPLYGSQVQQQLEQAGCEVSRAIVPAGEPSKSVAALSSLWEQAVDAGLDRHSCIVALGGGVVGDLAGFLAASYLRGVSFIQVPTSLLAMVDSSVGGKTGINLPQGKNLVGAFYQPLRVAIDLAVLETLADREYRSGLAEVIKYGVIRDAELFSYLETHVDAILAKEDEALAHIVARSCEIKADVVAADEREGGLRAILNYGHTLGHAIEQAEGYGAWLHGEAISIGMAYASDLSVEAHGLSPEEAERIKRLLVAYGLPVARGPFEGVVLERDSLEWAELRDVMSSDKKSLASVPRFVLASGIGAVDFGCEVDEQLLQDVWQRMS